MFALMFGIILMQATPLPCKMMEGVRLTFLPCGPRSTPPHFVGIIMKVIVLSVLAHTLVGTKLIMPRNTCHKC